MASRSGPQFWSIAPEQSASRALLIVTVIYASGLVWIAPHPPMVDLPQHAGQVAVLRDIVLGTSAWGGLRMNLLTPYLTGYGLAVPLSMVIPVSASLKLILTLAYLSFFAACVTIRKHLDGDERLDWLFVPGFFGLAWKWGFFTFLVAAPLGLVFILLGMRYADRPQRNKASLLLFVGIILFFSHALVFLLSAAVGLLCLLAAHNKNSAVLGAWPYAVLAILPAGYVLLLAGDPAASFGSGPTLWGPLSARLLSYPLFSWGTLEDPLFLGAAATVLCTPLVLRAQVNENRPEAFAPMSLLLLIWLFVPSFAIGTAFLYERFALFFLPFYALLFRSSREPGHAEPSDRVRSVLGMTMLVACCWSFLAVSTVRIYRFAHEAAEFDAVVASTEPGMRALALIFDPGSRAANNAAVYLHYPAWYQAERAGFVEFNFASYLPGVVRYRPGRLPPIKPGFEFHPELFDWGEHHGAEYRYFFVRHPEGAPSDLFSGATCTIRLLQSAGSWSVFAQQC